MRKSASSITKFTFDLPLANRVTDRTGSKLSVRTSEEAMLDSMTKKMDALLRGETKTSSEKMAELVCDILDLTTSESFKENAEIFTRTCVFFFEIGQSHIGISVGKRIASRAELFSNLPVQRRIYNMIGGQYCDIADFASAMEYLEIAVVLARKLGDPTVEAVCLANVIAVLQEMGHYRQAIALAERVLKLKDDSPLASAFKLQCSSNGLFAAHRVGNAAAAARFLKEGQTYLTCQTVALRRAFFEKGRSWYLVDLGEATKAKAHLDETLLAIQDDSSPRISTLLTVSAALCDWGLGDKEAARKCLEELHIESKGSKLYHHFVLQALIKVFSDSSTPVQASKGLGYARELVEYTTSVKKAKFYRQLANRQEGSDIRSGSLLTSTTIDPFNSVKEWLNASDITGASSDLIGSNQRVLTKHEELTVIHEDMAKLRAATLRRDIRTVAVDTAENWAIAAEFFDDETGQHCYRVGHLASMLARQVGMDDAFCIQVEHAARLHDIGKIAVNEVILLKPGPLDAAEMAAMRLHTEVGAQILSGSDDPTLKMAVEVARHHHEWWNGAGYPIKLVGKNIPFSARVCAFADVYDALTHARAYKKAWAHERALEEILRLSGSQFDPNLTEAFCAVLDRYRADLDASAIPGFVDMDSNSLIASRKKLMKTISADSS